jgi:hypothetical protein
VIKNIGKQHWQKALVKKLGENAYASSAAICPGESSQLVA